MRAAALLFCLILGVGPARGETVHEALDAYALYQADISALLDEPLESSAALDAALERASRHEPAAVARGWVAYGALTAAQSPAFANGVRSRVRAAGREPVLRQLQRDLSYARRRPPGSAEAIALVVHAVGSDGLRIQTAAERYENFGRTLDTSAWAPASARGAREARLREPPRASLSPPIAARLHIGPLIAAPLTDERAFGGARFWDGLANRAAPPAPQRTWRERRGYADSTDRMLTLAALIIVGAEASEPARVNAMLDDARLRDCLALEQLQFRQCASVAYGPDEDALCLARHGLSAPSACFGALAEPLH